MTEKLIKHFPDLGFSIVAFPGAYFVEYIIYAHDGCDNEIPYFHKQDSACYPDPVTTFEEADVFMHGDVKWDGCSNWYFDEMSRGAFHGCCREHLTNIGQIMGEAWDWTKEICQNWQG